MPHRFPEIEPYDSGMLEVGDGHRLFWEVSGDPRGKPAVVLHGGPGSGSSPGARRWFDPRSYRVVSFDQRNCGRSTPHASETDVDLSTNTTRHLVADCERIRAHLGIDRWLVLGVSWGSTLGLAYAETYPERVSEMILLNVVTTTRREVEWVTRAMGRLFPAAWSRFRNAVPVEDRDGDLAAAYHRLLRSPDRGVRERAALSWCDWEDTHVATYLGHRHDTRYDDARFRLCFARIVTHYWIHAGFVDDGELVRRAHRLAGIPGVLVHGRLDISSPPDVPWEIAQAWPGAELILVDNVGHQVGAPSMVDAVLAATNRFASTG